MRRIAVPAALAALALLAGCGGSDDPDPAPAPTSTAGTSPSGGGTSPSADVATGIRLSLPNSTVVAPADWTRGRKIVRGDKSADSPDHLAWIQLGEIQAFGSTQTAEELGRTRLESNLGKPPKLLPVTELDGVPVYHLAGWVGGSRYMEEYGAIRNDRIVSLHFSFNEKVSAAERQEIVDQVLPTFEWR